MINAPKIEIKYLLDYTLSFTSYSEQNAQANLSNLNSDRKFKGKKGLHLCGGSVDDDTGEVSGCPLDGTYTFYASGSQSYDGYLGNCLSNNNYEFLTPQTLTFTATNAGTYIKSILIYFDGVAGEYATELYFTNAIKENGTTDSRYTSAFRIKNSKNLFMYSFGENSDIKTITLNIAKWSKKNALVKIIKIKTGYTGLYDYGSIKSLKWDDNKFSDESELKFGVSSNTASFEIYDTDGVIYDLYAKNLIFQNVTAKIYIDGIFQGEFYIDQKDNQKGDETWAFDCIDFFERIKDDIVPMMQITNNCSLQEIISWCVGGKGISVEYTSEALTACQSFIVPKAFIKSQQTLYEVLLKVCQCGLLRMYVSLGKLKITRGV